MENKKAFFTKEYFCILFLWASIIISFTHFFQDASINRSLSWIGGQNPIWFLIWGFVTTVALFMNIRLLAKNIGLKNWSFDFLLGLTCLNLIVTVIINGGSPLRNQIHLATALSFAMFGFFALAIIFTLKMINQKTHTHYVFILFSSMILLGTFVLLEGLNAFSQIFMTNIGLGLLFVANFVEKPNNNTAQLSTDTFEPRDNETPRYLYIQNEDTDPPTT